MEIMATLKSAFLRCVELTGMSALVGGPQALAKALREAQIEMARIAFEHQLARERGVSMAEAALDHDNYPAFAKFHAALEDVLRWQLPPRLAQWCAPLFRPDQALEGMMEHLLRTAVNATRTSPSPQTRAICEILLFEGLRIGLILEEEMDASGSLRTPAGDIARSVIAEDELQRWLADPEIDDFGVVRLATATASLSQLAYARDLQLALMQVHQAIRDAEHADIVRADVLGKLDAKDAIILRNASAEDFEEQKLSVSLLRARHAAVLGHLSDDAIYQRLCQLRARIRSHGLESLKRTSPAIIDLACDAAKAHA